MPLVHCHFMQPEQGFLAIPGGKEPLRYRLLMAASVVQLAESNKLHCQASVARVQQRKCSGLWLCLLC
jgi:hypothetical protein